MVKVANLPKVGVHSVGDVPKPKVGVGDVLKMSNLLKVGVGEVLFPTVMPITLHITCHGYTPNKCSSQLPFSESQNNHASSAREFNIRDRCSSPGAPLLLIVVVKVV